MKKNFLLVTLSLSLFILSSCKKQKEVTPPPASPPPLSIPSPPPPKRTEPPKQIVRENIQEEVIQTRDENQEVKKNFETYLSALKGFDSDLVVYMTYPNLFTIINREHFKQYINSMMNSSDILVESLEFNITYVHEVGYFNQGEFTIIEYDSKTTIVLINANLYSNKTEFNFLYDAFIHKYGQENIKFSTEDRSISIKEKKKILAIKEANREWKFLNINPEYQKFYPLILPSHLLEQLQFM